MIKRIGLLLVLYPAISVADAVVPVDAVEESVNIRLSPDAAQWAGAGRHPTDRFAATRRGGLPGFLLQSLAHRARRASLSPRYERRRRQNRRPS